MLGQETVPPPTLSSFSSFQHSDSLPSISFYTSTIESTRKTPFQQSSKSFFSITSYFGLTSLMVFPFSKFFQSRPCYWSYLPREVQLSILTHISYPQRLTLSRISKEWYSLLHDGSLLTNLDFSESQYQVSEPVALELLFSANKCLRKLDLRECNHLTEPFFRSIPQFCPYLHSLDISGLHPLTAPVLTSLVHQFPYLREFSCAFSLHFQDLHLYELLQTCIHLTSLNVSGCRGLTSQGIHQAFNQVPQPCQLTNLNLSKVNLSTHFLNVLLQRCPKLKVVELGYVPLLFSPTTQSQSNSLNLRGMGASEEGGSTTVLTTFSGSTLSTSSILQVQFISLVYLHLSQTPLNDTLLIWIPQGCPCLKRLELSGCGQVTSVGLRALHACTKLEHVDVEEVTTLDDVTFKLWMQHWSSLSYLNVSACFKLTELGWLRWNEGGHQLHSLIIQRVSTLTDRVLSTFRNPTKVPQLTLLDLRDCTRISKEKIDALIRARPTLEVRSVYGVSSSTRQLVMDEMNEPTATPAEDEEEEELVTDENTLSSAYQVSTLSSIRSFITRMHEPLLTNHIVQSLWPWISFPWQYINSRFLKPNSTTTFSSSSSSSFS